MAITATAAQNSILMLNVAMFGQAAGTTVMAAALPTFVDGNTYAQQLYTTSDAYKILSPEQAFTKVINNLSAGTGITAADVEALAKGMVPFVDAGLSVGATINLLTAFLYGNAGELTGDAAAWNNTAVQLVNKTTAAAYYTLDQNQPTTSTSAIANVTYRTGTDATSVSFQLTTAAETFVGGAGADTFYAVVGNTVGFQDQSTLNSGDSMVGGLNEDIMYVNMTGNYNGGAMIHGIETLRLGTNIAAVAGAPITFDYNVNAGQPQVADVTTLVYDQINMGESLRVSNILKTGDALPALLWSNEAGSAAGNIQADYRTATVSGTTTAQTVTLDNVNGNNTITTGTGSDANTLTARMDIGSGVETLTIVSAGTTGMNTLHNSNRADGGAVDVVSEGTSPAVLGNGVNDDSSLTKVIIQGSQQFGKGAQVVASTTDGSYGLTDRAAAGAHDMGISASTGLYRSTTSNLVSMAATVTTVDASEATGNQYIRFTAKQNASDTNVSYLGSTVTDYVEFQQGNVTAAGNDGADTFAFLNNNLANATFGESDKLDGGAGEDTIQIGLNGAAVAGNYNISETELRNKTKIDVLDLRGQTVNLTLSSDFVAAADAATITVRTDKIVQTSDTDALNNANTITNNGLENAATDTVNLTKLNSSQGITYLGGSGSDRIILNDATFNILQKIDGGVYTDATLRAAGSNRYDTITVVTNGENVVIDAQDLSQVKNVEGFVLTKNSARANYTISLTQAFLNANTQASDNANTAINDTIFQIGTSAAANNSALAAGDTVTIDIRNLLNATDTGRAGGFTVRSFDVSSLVNAGINPIFVGNTGNLTLAQVRAIAGSPLVAQGADANFADVTTTSAANPAAGGGVAPAGTVVAVTTGTAVIGTAASEDFQLSAAIVSGVSADTTINGAGGTNTVTLFQTAANTASVLSTAAGTTDVVISNIDNLILGQSGDTIVVNDANARLANITGGTGSDLVTLTSLAGGGTIALGAGNNTLEVQANLAGASTWTAGAGVDTLKLTTAGQNISANTITGFEVLDVSSAQNHTLTNAQFASFTGGITGAAGQTLTISNGGAVVINGANDTESGITLGAAGSITVLNATAVAHTFTGSASADTINLGASASGGDSITAGAGDDNITGSSAAKATINGGTGNDTITLLNNGAQDEVMYATGTDGRDTINGFVATSDKYDTNFAPNAATPLALQAAAAVNTGAALALATSGAGTSGIKNLTGTALTTATAGDAATLIAAISNGTITTTAANDKVMLLVENATQSFLYEVTDSNASGTITTADTINLVAIFNVTNLANGDII